MTHDGRTAMVPLRNVHKKHAPHQPVEQLRTARLSGLPGAATLYCLAKVVHPRTFFVHTAPETLMQPFYMTSQWVHHFHCQRLSPTVLCACKCPGSLRATTQSDCRQ